jgi:hypothetical protein
MNGHRNLDSNDQVMPKLIRLRGHRSCSLGSTQYRWDDGTPDQIRCAALGSISITALNNCKTYAHKYIFSVIYKKALRRNNLLNFIFRCI